MGVDDVKEVSDDIIWRTILAWRDVAGSFFEPSEKSPNASSKRPFSEKINGYVAKNCKKKNYNRNDFFFLTIEQGRNAFFKYSSWTLFLLRNNVGYSSSCSSIGQAIGLILGSVFPILFTSDQFCNKYIRTEPAAGGIITLESKATKR